MLKDKLMSALDIAVRSYNNGCRPSDAVADAAEKFDFNEKQAERLVETFNTALALKQQKDADDPTASCELADKGEVSKRLIDSCSCDLKKNAGADFTSEYSFYMGVPECTNNTLEAKRRGVFSNIKEASSEDAGIPEELDISQNSLFETIIGKIDILKSASAAADEVVRCINHNIEQDAEKIANGIGDSTELADMFKASCCSDAVIEKIAEYNVNVAESNGGKYAKEGIVFDSKRIDHLLKAAEDLAGCIDMAKAYQVKRDMYLRESDEAHKSMMSILGLSPVEKKASLADFFDAGAVAPDQVQEGMDGDANTDESYTLSDLGASDIINNEDNIEDGSGLYDMHKESAVAPSGVMGMIELSPGKALSVLEEVKGVPDEKRRMLNVRRAILLSDLLSTDPILRDADPNVLSEAYKTIVMASPRVSLDKAQVRSVLRAAANSVAISPADVKIISDVDRGVAISNVERLTALDSSIKDSNIA